MTLDIIFVIYLDMLFKVLYLDIILSKTDYFIHDNSGSQNIEDSNELPGSIHIILITESPASSFSEKNNV